MSSTIVFFFFIPLLSIILLAVNLIFAPHNPYMEKNGAFECGFSSFLGQNRTQFTISFFIFALLFLLFDLEILLVYPYLVSAYTNETYGLVVVLIFVLVLTLGFAFELGKKALTIDSRQVIQVSHTLKNQSSTLSSIKVVSPNMRYLKGASYLPTRVGIPHIAARSFSTSPIIKTKEPDIIGKGLESVVEQDASRSGNEVAPSTDAAPSTDVLSSTDVLPSTVVYPMVQYKNQLLGYEKNTTEEYKKACEQALEDIAAKRKAGDISSVSDYSEDVGNKKIKLNDDQADSETSVTDSVTDSETNSESSEQESEQDETNNGELINEGDLPGHRIILEENPMSDPLNYKRVWDWIMPPVPGLAQQDQVNETKQQDKVNETKQQDQGIKDKSVEKPEKVSEPVDPDSNNSQPEHNKSELAENSSDKPEPMDIDKDSISGFVENSSDKAQPMDTNIEGGESI